VAFGEVKSRVRLYHDDELDDIALLLHELGAEVENRPGHDAVLDPSEANPAIVVATPCRVMHYQPLLDVARPTLIVVLDGDSRMLRAHLRRIDVDMLVRRPVHPEALRLLLLHELYRGPERRGRERVTIGAWIRVKSGLFSKPAILTEVSLHGCRLLSRTRPNPGRSVKLYVPADVGGGRAIKLRGTIVRIVASSDHVGLAWLVGVRFDEPKRRVADRIKAIVDAHTNGPARIDLTSGVIGAAPEPCEIAQNDSVTETANDAAVSGEVHVDEADTSGAIGDRRSSQRHSYDRRVVALGSESTRVLLGRDISTRSMRVESAPDLVVGDKLRLAIHSGADDEPLVVEAEVCRDDGDSGLVLAFDPDEALEGRIGQMLLDLPLLGRNKSGDDDAGGLVVSEIIGQEAG